jgi:hypothetical protein
VVYHHDHLRLCRIGYCETEDERESEQNSFHNTVCRSGKSIYRATMTTARKLRLGMPGEQMPSAPTRAHRAETRAFAASR